MHKSEKYFPSIIKEIGLLSAWSRIDDEVWSFSDNERSLVWVDKRSDIDEIEDRCIEVIGLEPFFDNEFDDLWPFFGVRFDESIIIMII